MSKLKPKLRSKSCGIKVFTLLIRRAPSFWDTVVDIAVLVWANIHIIADKNEPTSPIAAKDSVGFSSTPPIITKSVNEIKGSAIPAMIAGIAILLISLKLTLFAFT